MAKLVHGGGFRLLAQWVAACRLRARAPDDQPHRDAETTAQHSPQLACAECAPAHGALLPQTVMLIMIEENAGAFLMPALQAGGRAVLVVDGLANAAARLRQVQPQLIIAAGANAPSECLELRRWSQAPLLVLLAPASPFGSLEMLNAGADDCQSMAIGSAEVVMRVGTLLRRGLPA